MGGPENGNFPLLYVVKCPYVGGWVVQKSLKTPLRNIKMAPYTIIQVSFPLLYVVKMSLCRWVGGSRQPQNTLT